MLGLPRAAVYRKPKPADSDDLELMRLIDEQYLRTPFYGARKMAVVLSRSGHQVGRKRVMPRTAPKGPDTPEKKPADKGARCARARYTTGADHRTNMGGDRGAWCADRAASSMIGRLTSEEALGEVFRQVF